jgi:hypothetical protein
MRRAAVNALCLALALGTSSPALAGRTRLGPAVLSAAPARGAAAKRPAVAKPAAIEGSVERTPAAAKGAADKAAPKEEVTSVAPRGPTRIDFDDRLIQGQTNKSGAVYLFDRKELSVRSMVQQRTSFRDQIVRDILAE